jgi:hypothetical protein
MQSQNQGQVDRSTHAAPCHDRSSGCRHDEFRNQAAENGRVPVRVPVGGAYSSVEVPPPVGSLPFGQ